VDAMKRRAFLKMAAILGPCLAAGSDELLLAQKKKEKEEDGLMVVSNLCTACGECAKVCPVEAIAIKNGKVSIDNSECIGCDACISECPTDAILYKKDLEAYKKAHPERFKPSPKK
jgi:Fe-S-cluster-containing dehydrogenase component